MTLSDDDIDEDDDNFYDDDNVDINGSDILTNSWRLNTAGCQLVSHSIHKLMDSVHKLIHNPKANVNTTDSNKPEEKAPWSFGSQKFGSRRWCS